MGEERVREEDIERGGEWMKGRKLRWWERDNTYWCS